MSRTPSPECPLRYRPHAEHMFRAFGTGAHIDCPGRVERCELHPAYDADYCPICGTARVIGGSR